MTDAGAVLDRDVLADLQTLGPALLALVPDHNSTFCAGLADLAAAARAGAAPRVERLAHGLKGSSGCMAARQVAARCARIQTAAAQGLCPAPAELSELRAEHDRAVAALYLSLGGLDPV